MFKNLFVGAGVLLALSLSPLVQADWLTQGDSYLENMGNETVTLTFSDLGEHSYVKLNWDLYLMDTWDGYNEENEYSTDFWGFSVDGQSFDWAFSMVKNSNDTNPDEGFRYYSSNPDIHTLPVTSRLDNVLFFDNYNDGWIFNHTSDTLTVTFFAYGLQKITDESWAIDDIYIGTGNDFVALDAIGNLQDVPSPLIFSPALLAFLMLRRSKSRNELRF